MFTPKIEDWREITYTAGSVIKCKDHDSPPLSGSGVYKPGRKTTPSYQQLKLNIKINGHHDHDGPTNTINRAELPAHSGIIDNEGADACARSAALTATTDIALPDARDPFYNIHWLSLKTSHGQTDGLHRARALPIHYLTNLNDKLKVHMHKKRLALLIPLDTTIRDGRNLTIPYHPPPLQTQKHTTQSLDLLTRRSATPSGKIQRLL
eukprot:1145187-Pelagomonas_calceolata.AAC.1